MLSNGTAWLLSWTLSTVANASARNVPLSSSAISLNSRWLAPDQVGLVASAFLVRSAASSACDSTIITEVTLSIYG